jgi:Endonuclease/Exonuclease/phosphatase family
MAAFVPSEASGTDVDFETLAERAPQSKNSRTAERGTMARHARRKRWSAVKAVASGVVVVVFLAFAVAGAFGWIGGPEDPGEGSVKAVDTQATGNAEADPSEGSEVEASSSASPDEEEDQEVQKVRKAKKLKRTVEWLRREAGLADATTFRVASFNVLGDSHTRPGGNKKGWASSGARMAWTVSLFRNADIDVVGLQEFEPIQYNQFRAHMPNWDVSPGPTLDRGSIRNSLAWDTTVWELVEETSVGIPYFGGQIIRRPVVLLKNIESEREVWFFNTHNPASTPRWGNNARHRAAAISIQVRLANELGADGTPVVFTGDFNDRAEAFCPLTGQTDLEAAAGGTGDDGCVLPPRPGVDWIFGSGIEFTEYASVATGVVGRVSDHPFVYAEGFIPEEPLVNTEPDAGSD